MNLLILGTGYVGLVTGACFAEMGHRVTCLDIDAAKIEQLQRGEIPFFEPGLEEIVQRNQAAGRLNFTTSIAAAIQDADVCFLAVATPSLQDGSCDLGYLLNAAKSIGAHMERPLLIANKSTAPVGTAEEIERVIQGELEKRGLPQLSFDVVANPEFLKQGAAVADCLKPDRVIVGTKSEKALEQMRELYAPFTLNRERIFATDKASAEMIKYAANAMLAARISFMNELAKICEEVHANIHEVRLGIGSDPRIGSHFLYPGIGYGGSCIPKDIRALIALAKAHKVETPILEAIQTTNEGQKKLFLGKLERHFAPEGGLKGKVIALWGLSFKPNTDDLREAPSLSLIEKLLEQGAELRLYDPIALSKARLALASHPKLHFCKDEYHAALGADAIALITEWKQFRFVDFEKILPTMRQPTLFDGRNQYKKSEMKKKGFTYFGIGIPKH